MNVAAITAIVTTVTTLASVAVGLWVAKTNHERGVREHDLKADESVHNMRQELLADMQKMNQLLTNRIDDLEEDVKEMQSKIASLRSLFRTALDVIRDLVRTERVKRHELPEEILEEL